MKLSPAITMVPILHGKIAFTEHVRSLFADGRFDCVALDIPVVFQDDIGPAVEALPIIQAITARTFSTDTAFYLPIDPCDATIEGIRQAFAHRLPFFCIGDGDLKRPSPLPPLPDEYAISRIGLDAFSTFCLKATGNYEKESPEDTGGRCMAARLHELSKRYRNIIALVHFRHYARAVYHYGMAGAAGPPDIQSCRTAVFTVNPDHLYFALGELPFITGKFERSRYDALAAAPDILQEIKDLFCETRDQYYDTREQIIDLSPVRVQAALTFLRNLTVSSGMLLPSLFDIVEAAKGVGGNAYALRILKSARYYPYLPLDDTAAQLGIGPDRIRFPDTGETSDAVNLFRNAEIFWRTISIRPDPSLERKKKYRYAWNPLGMCSHTPEDDKIERFNEHVRAKTVRLLTEEFSRCEKFSTSVKDGIDIRETVRNWHTGDIYVREIPPSRGRVDTVVIIFDDCHDELYPHRTAWYAEHAEESTLTFFATNPAENLIGPGIAESRYGGLSLLFPPRPVPNIFDMEIEMALPDLTSRLTFGALLFSAEKTVAFVSERKPGAIIRDIAVRLKKNLVWIPMASFSNETIRRLRRFHILNGKTVRSWAARFIGDE